MNIPTMESTSVTAGGRPETVAPNTTSCRPVSWPSSTAQVPWTRVLTVTPSSEARRFSSLTSSSGRGSSTCPIPELPS